MISSVSLNNCRLSFGAVITGTRTFHKRGEKFKEDLFTPIKTTPDMDLAINSQLRAMRCVTGPRQILVKCFDIAKTPDLKKLMRLISIPDDILPAEGICIIAGTRHQRPTGKDIAIYRDIKITINSAISIVLDFNKRNQGLVSIKELRKGLRP